MLVVATADMSGLILGPPGSKVVLGFQADTVPPRHYEVFFKNAPSAHPCIDEIKFLSIDKAINKVFIQYRQGGRSHSLFLMPSQCQGWISKYRREKYGGLYRGETGTT